MGKRQPIILQNILNPNILHPYGYVYMTYDTVKNKRYIGQHKGVKFDSHYYGTGTIILNIVRKRPETLQVKIIEWADSCKKLDKREIYWIKFFNAVDSTDFYNLAPGGEGYVLTEYQRTLMSKRNSGVGNPRYNAKLSEETKQKISNALKGKMSGEKNPFYNKTHTEESLNKMRGRVMSEEQKQHLRILNTGKESPLKGRHLSEDAKNRLRKPRPQIKGENNPNFGNKWSEEQKLRMSMIKSGENNPNRKPILRLSPEGTLLEEYAMIKQAIQQGYSSGGIQGCLHKRTKKGTYKGFQWVYKHDYKGGDTK